MRTSASAPTLSLASRLLIPGVKTTPPIQDRKDWVRPCAHPRCRRPKPHDGPVLPPGCDRAGGGHRAQRRRPGQPDPPYRRGCGERFRRNGLHAQPRSPRQARRRSDVPGGLRPRPSRDGGRCPRRLDGPRAAGAEIERVTGADIVAPLCRAAAERGLPVYFLGTTAAILDRTAARLTAESPALVVAAARRRPSASFRTARRPSTRRADRRQRRAHLLRRARRAQAGTLRRPRGLAHDRHHLHLRRGALDFLAGAQVRAPRAIQAIGWNGPGGSPSIRAVSPTVTAVPPPT